MLRNISLGFLLFALLQIWMIALNFHSQALVVTIGALVLSRVAYLRSRMFYHWFFTDIYEASLEYGTSLKEVVEYNRRSNKDNARFRGRHKI